VHLQEEGSICRYGIVRFNFISTSNLVGRRVCSILLYAFVTTRQLIPMHLKRTIRLMYINRLPEDEPSGSKHVEDIKN